MVLNATPKSCLVSQVVFLILAVSVCGLTSSGVRLWRLEWKRAFSCSHTHSLPYFPPNSCPKYRCMKSVKGMSLVLCAYMLLEINQLPATLSSRTCWGAKCCKPELVWNRHGLWEQRSAFFSLTGVILSNVGRGQFQNQRRRDILALSECEGKLRYENKWNEFYSSMCFIVP